MYRLAVCSFIHYQHILLDIKVVLLNLIAGGNELFAEEQGLVGALGEPGLAVGDELEQSAALLDVLQDFCVGHIVGGLSFFLGRVVMLLAAHELECVRDARLMRSPFSSPTK